MKKSSNSFIKGAIVLSVGGFVSKLIGALYRIPLTNLLGSYGMGVYQLIFPLYALLLTVSSAGIPVAISKLVSERIQLGLHEQARQVFRTALVALSLLGFVGSAILFFVAPVISSVQGNLDATIAYRIISPSVMLVCIISAFRGYFQGNMNMVPTALSQIVEQLVKMSLALSCVIFIAKDAISGVYLSVLAVTASELVAMLLLAITYIAKRGKRKQIAGTSHMSALGIAKKIFLLSVPITLSGIILPLTQLVDSVLVLNLIDKDNATQLYGLWSGPVHSLLNLPVVLTLGIATAVIPSLSRVNISGNTKLLNERINSALKLTMLLALPCTVGLLVLSLPIARLLYGRLPAQEILAISQLLKASCLSVLFLSVVQTTTATLQACGKLYVPVTMLAVATVAKTVLNLFLLGNPTINIFGAAFSSVICYLVAAVGNLWYITVKLKVKMHLTETVLKPLACTTIMSVALLLFTTLGAQLIKNYLIALLLSITISVLIFGLALWKFKIFTKSEMQALLHKN